VGVALQRKRKNKIVTLILLLILGVNSISIPFLNTSEYQVPQEKNDKN